MKNIYFKICLLIVLILPFGCSKKGARFTGTWISISDGTSRIDIIPMSESEFQWQKIDQGNVLYEAKAWLNPNNSDELIVDIDKGGVHFVELKKGKDSPFLEFDGAYFKRIEISQTPKAEQKSKDTFLSTFIKTPFIALVFCISIFSLMISGVIEGAIWVIPGIDTNFETSSEIWEIVWNQIIIGHWWDVGIWWHLLISIVIWLLLLFIFGSNS